MEKKVIEYKTQALLYFGNLISASMQEYVQEHCQKYIM